MSESKQPEALRLAKILETEATHSIALDLEAADELRRQYALNTELLEALNRQYALNTELLYALKRALKELDRDWDGCVNSRKGETIFAIRKVINETN